MSELIYYFDSSVFVSFFNNEQEKKRADIVEQVLNEAHAGRAAVVTSSFALVEVLKLKGHTPLAKEDEDKIVDFFQYPFIRLVDATRDVCEHARRLIWSYPALHPKDAVHLASALTFAGRAHLDGLFSYDNDFIKLNGIITKQFPIVEPFMKQMNLALGISTPKKITSVKRRFELGA